MQTVRQQEGENGVKRKEMDNSKIDKLMSKDKEEVMRLLLMFDDERSIPSFLNLLDYVEFAERIDRTINFITASDNSRLIVIETWLIVDHSIRHILTYGLEIDKFCDENFNILPQGFRDCALLLQNFIKQQKGKPPNPSRFRINLPSEFKKAIIEDKEFFKQYIKYEEAFYEKVNASYPTFVDLRGNKFRNVDDGWLKAVEKLDDNWFVKANKLNSIRNYAAHSFDEERIYKELGLKGSKKIEKLKDYCINTIKDLIGLK